MFVVLCLGAEKKKKKKGIGFNCSSVFVSRQFFTLKIYRTYLNLEHLTIVKLDFGVLFNFFSCQKNGFWIGEIEIPLVVF